MRSARSLFWPWPSRAVAPESRKGTGPGRWREVPEYLRTGAGDEADLDALEAIGYAGDTGQAATGIGVTVFDRDAARAGLNLVTSGHAPEAVLMEMDGSVRHTWRAWPARRVARSSYAPGDTRTRLLAARSVAAWGRADRDFRRARDRQARSRFEPAVGQPGSCASRSRAYGRWWSVDPHAARASASEHRGQADRARGLRHSAGCGWRGHREHLASRLLREPRLTAT